MEKTGNSTYNREKKTRFENLVFYTIPAAGVEPARCCHRWILSPVRLPIPPCWHSYILTHGYLFVNFTLYVKELMIICHTNLLEFQSEILRYMIKLFNEIFN